MTNFDWTAAFSAASLLAAGIYLMLSWNLQRAIIGFLLLSNGVNLAIMAVSGLPERAVVPLIVDEAGLNYTDPLPHAFLLTAIVIGFGIAAFLTGLALRTEMLAGKIRGNPSREDGG
jgi:multicomponent Na+:H+ antiporter subunit C